MTRGMLLAAFLLAAVPAFAGDFESGVDAYKRGDYAQALAWCGDSVK